MVRHSLQRNCTDGQVRPDFSSRARIDSMSTVTTRSHLGHLPDMTSSATRDRATTDWILLSLLRGDAANNRWSAWTRRLPDCAADQHSMLNIFCLGPKGQIFVDCRVPPGKPLRRQSGPIRNSKARPAESVNDLGSRAVFQHRFQKKSLRSA